MFSLCWLCLLVGCQISLAKGAPYKVEVKTGSSDGAGTDADVYIKIVGAKDITGKHELHSSGDDFEEGHLDTFRVDDDVGIPYMIKVSRDGHLFGGEWELAWIRVTYKGIGYMFKFNGWIKPRTWYDIKISCNDGYKLGSDNQCTDIDECKTKCLAGTCVNSEGSYKCTCKQGYRFKDGQCEDIDECTMDIHGCEQDCVNTKGSYRCTCTPGYTVQGTRCVNIDECAKNICKENTKCVDTIGSFRCNCKQGYQRKDSLSCQDINECNALNKCSYKVSKCVNFAGGYSCKCHDGYIKNSQYGCKDIDECADNSHKCDKTTSQCVNGAGYYYCKCNIGYHQEKDNKICMKDKCGPMSKPYASVVSPSRCTDSADNYFGDVCTLTCNNGYELENPKVSTTKCAAGGKWEGIPRCTRVRCPALSGIANGKLYPSFCTVNGNTYEGQCSYLCKTGYVSNGSPVRECRADKTWSGSKPTCVKVVNKPSVHCPPDIVTDLALGQKTADLSAVWKDPTYTGAILLVNPTTASAKYPYPAGINRITWTAKNSAGSDSCSILVMVNDKEAPKKTNCPTGPIAVQTTNDKAAVTWATPSFTDNVGVTKETSTHSSGDVFGVGSWNVYYTASDAAGNRADCNFEVIVKRQGCPLLPGPKFGNKQCGSFGSSKYCQITCPSGKQIFNNPSEYSFWSCSKAKWIPTESVPDCVDATLNKDGSACTGNQVKMTIKTAQSTDAYCADCPTGTYSSNGKCTLCTPGHYQDQPGGSSCKTCPSGTKSFSGASDLKHCRAVCRPGHYSKDGMDPGCQICPRDTYQDLPKSTSCTACPKGTTTLSSGRTKLEDCGAKPLISSLAPKNTTIDEGQSTSLTCLIFGVPTPLMTIKFRKNIPPSYLGKEQRETLKDSSGKVIGIKLTITGAKHENSGHYECKGVNKFGIAVDSALLNVNIVYGSGAGPSMDEQEFL